MPISDPETYDVGHFGRVYEHIIKPACKAANLEPIRADEVQVTNYIVIDILKKILEAKIVICDLSSRNPNVLYELGIRQAFNLPVTLIKDFKTPKIFDIQGLRYIEYDENLRIDKISEAVESLSVTLKNTSVIDKTEVNSIIQLLGVAVAKVPSVEISTDTNLILSALNDIAKRLSKLENTAARAELSPLLKNMPSTQSFPSRKFFPIDKNSALIGVGDEVQHPHFGVGRVYSISEEYVYVEDKDGKKLGYSIPAGEVRALERLSD